MLEAEDRVELVVGRGRAQAAGGQRPLVERGALVVEAAVGSAVVLAFDPGPETAVEGVEAGARGLVQGRQELGSAGPEKTLDFPLSLRRVRSRMDQMDAKAGADHGQVAGAVGGPVVAVQSLRDAAFEQGLAQDGQERLGAFGEGEGGVRDDARGIVNDGQQVGLAPPPPVVGIAADLGAMHAIGHPQRARVGVAEAAPVAAVGTVLGRPRQALLAQQAVDRGRGQGGRRGHAAAGPRLADQRAHRQLAVGLLEAHQQLADRWRQAARLAAVLAPLGVQRVEAAVFVQAQPVADGGDGDARATAAGNGVRAPGLVADQGPALGRSWRQAQDLRNHAVAEQGDLAPEVWGLVWHAGGSWRAVRAARCPDSRQAGRAASGPSRVARAGTPV